MKTYGYARVSSADQNATRQLDAMEKVGIARANIFVDHKSGRDFDRPAWRQLVAQIRRGDLIVVTSLDRLGRDYEEIGEVWRHLTRERRVDIRVLNVELLDTRRRHGLTGTFIADFVLQLLAYLAQQERENIRARQAEGIAAAKRRGVHLGRPRRTPPPGFEEIVAEVRAGARSQVVAARRVGLATSTFRLLMNRPQR
ncbi:MAG: recombinase family protein [Kiritimatiellae bacterium]|nr:recombinase family protein [Kiritimatiellia bacterium]